jgi:hypothetical protein
MGTIELLILIILILMIASSAPVWPHSRSWGYYPTGGLATLLIIVLLFILLF